jgi:putative ATPase
MRPRTLDEFLGQGHLVGPGKVLRRAIEADQVPSMVLWGPPGSGKTTLANLIASLTSFHFEPVSAVTSGVADLRCIIAYARERLSLHDQRTILFIDEIHRFNKAQQDVVLPHVEDGTIILIGATTENPSFEVVSPLLSRSRVFTLHQLDDQHIRSLVERSLADSERGLGGLNVALDPDAMDFLVNMSNGDARVALNTLELAAQSAVPGENGARRVTLAILEDALQRRAILYDCAGDQHYDTISAFIKSVRGSDPDAALYWLGRMLEAGEDPLFIARRLIILAAEDIGLADPQALSIAVAAQQAVHLIGLPEGRIPLAEATVYLATCHKSNSAYAAFNAAMEDVQKTRNEPIPVHLRNAVTPLMRGMGYGKEYKYAHEYQGNFAAQEHLPPSLQGRHYYHPVDQGAEADAAQRLKKWRDAKARGSDAKKEE